jgi:hypothetical protein
LAKLLNSHDSEWFCELYPWTFCEERKQTNPLNFIQSNSIQVFVVCKNFEIMMCFNFTYSTFLR